MELSTELENVQKRAAEAQDALTTALSKGETLEKTLQENESVLAASQKQERASNERINEMQVEIITLHKNTHSLEEAKAKLERLAEHTQYHQQD